MEPLKVYLNRNRERCGKQDRVRCMSVHLHLSWQRGEKDVEIYLQHVFGSKNAVFEGSRSGLAQPERGDP